MAGRLQDSVALITGAARGIGRATATLFLGEGARVALLDQDGEAVETTAATLSEQFGQTLVHWRAADIASPAEIDRAVAELAGAMGGLDILVNNAASRAFGPVAEATPESWAAILNVNVTGLANCCRAALPYLRQSARGSIVNVASVFALAGRRNMGQYDASKAAIVALTRVLACEEAEHGVRVNAVCPGSTLTPWTVGRAAARGMTPHELRRIGAVPSLLGRWAEPEEVAYPILWLASSEASFMTGVALPVDGGLTAM